MHSFINSVINSFHSFISFSHSFISLHFISFHSIPFHFISCHFIQSFIRLFHLFPTSQVRVVRFYVSCLLLLLLVLFSSPLLLVSSSSPPAGPHPRSSTPTSCRTSTTIIHAQCSLPDLNHDHPRKVEVRQGTLCVDDRG